MPLIPDGIDPEMFKDIWHEGEMEALVRARRAEARVKELEAESERIGSALMQRDDEISKRMGIIRGLRADIGRLEAELAEERARLDAIVLDGLEPQSRDRMIWDVFNRKTQRFVVSDCVSGYRAAIDAARKARPA